MGDKCFRVHVEVAKAFIPNPECKPTVNHKNGNKLDNNHSNLEWATHNEQTIHAHNNGLMNVAKGEACHFSVLTEDQVLEILNNPQIRNIEFSRKFNVVRSAISKIRSGKTWKHIQQIN